MSLSIILIIMGVIVLVGIVIANMINQTFENMKKTTEYTKQIIKDSERTLEVIKKMANLLRQERFDNEG